MKNKTVILLCICFTVVFTAASYIFMWKYDNRYNKIKDFYSSEIMEDKELIESIYENYGLFKYLHFKNQSEEEMLANYFDFFDYFFDEEMTRDIRLSGVAKIEDFELSVGDISTGPSMSGTLEGVISGNEDVIDEMFTRIDREQVDSHASAVYQRRWYEFYCQGIEIEECAIHLPFCSYMDFGDKSVWTSNGEIIYLFSKPVDGKQYVFLYRNCVGVTTGVNRW